MNSQRAFLSNESNYTVFPCGRQGDQISCTIKCTNKRNLFTCQSAVNYRLNLCKANKVKKRAVLALTLHKECDIVVLYRINRYSSA